MISVTAPGRSSDAFDVPRRGGRIVAGVTFEPGDARDERREGGRRLHDQVRQRVRAAARLEKPFAQVQQMAARLHFARPPHVGGVDRERRERVAAGDDDVIREDRAELERERVERSLELARGDEQRRGEAGVVPRGDASGGGAQIVVRHRLHDRERRRRRAVVSVMSVAMAPRGAR